MHFYGVKIGNKIFKQVTLYSSMSGVVTDAVYVTTVKLHTE